MKKQIWPRGREKIPEVNKHPCLSPAEKWYYIEPMPKTIIPGEYNFVYAEGENQQFSSLSGKSLLSIITYIYLEFMNQKEIA